MIFTCVLDGYPLADYLNPEVTILPVWFMMFTMIVLKNISASVIYGTFFDEPSMFHAQFSMWTPQFNEKFMAKYGFSPVTVSGNVV